MVYKAANSQQSNTYQYSTDKKVRKLFEVPTYKYIPANVLENDNFKLYWNCSILTDKTILFDRPD